MRGPARVGHPRTGVVLDDEKCHPNPTGGPSHCGRIRIPMPRPPACQSGLLPAAALSMCVDRAGVSQDWIPLFDGRGLSGWKASEHAESFRVEDGRIVCDGPSAHLFYVGDVAGADFTLCANSPCLPEYNGCNVLIGAYGEGCAECSSPVEDRSWGAIKAMYR